MLIFRRLHISWLITVGLGDFVSTFEAAGYYTAEDISNLSEYDARCIAEEEICIPDPKLIEGFLRAYSSAGSHVGESTPAEGNCISSPPSPEASEESQVAAPSKGNDQRRSKLQIAIRSGRRSVVEIVLERVLKEGLPKDDPVVETCRDWLNPSARVSTFSEEATFPAPTNPVTGEGGAGVPIWMPIVRKPTQDGREKLVPAPAAAVNRSVAAAAAPSNLASFMGSLPCDSGEQNGTVRSPSLAAFMKAVDGSSQIQAAAVSVSEEEHQPPQAITNTPSLVAFMQAVERRSQVEASSTTSNNAAPAFDDTGDNKNNSHQRKPVMREGNQQGENGTRTSCSIALLSDYLMIQILTFTGMFFDVYRLRQVTGRWKGSVNRLNRIHVHGSSFHGSMRGSSVEQVCRAHVKTVDFFRRVPEEFPQLVNLRIEDINLLPDGVKALLDLLATIPNLVTFALKGWKGKKALEFPSDWLVRNFTGLSRLRNVSFDKVPLVCLAILVSHTPQLASLSIVDSPHFNNAELEQLERPLAEGPCRRSLRCLTLAGCAEITDDALAKCLGCLSNLASLDLSRCPCVGRSLSFLFVLPNLRQLNLKGCKGLLDATCDLLATAMDRSERQLPELRDLSLCSNLSDLGVRNLLRCLPYLRRLELNFISGISDATAVSVAHHCTQIESLAIYWCVLFTDKGAAQLTQLPYMRFLNLGKCRKITKWTLRAFAKGKKPVNIAALGTQITQEDCMEYRRANGGFAYAEDNYRNGGVKASWFLE